MGKKISIELIFAGAFTLLAVVLTFFIVPDQIRATGPMPNERTFPIVFTVVLSILCLMWVVDVLRRKESGDDATTLKGIGLGFILWGVVFLLNVFGYVISSLIAVTGIALLINREKWLWAGVFGVCVSVLFFFFFQHLLDVSFPVGLIFGD